MHMKRRHMSTQAFDAVTIFKCLAQLEAQFLGENREWEPQNDEQERLFTLYQQMKDYLAQIRGLKAKGSKFYTELNDFLVEEGFSPMFQPFNPEDSVGVATVLDKMVEWFVEAELVNITAQNGREYPGFEIPKQGVSIYTTNYGTLAELYTKSEDTVWLLLPTANQPDLLGFNLFETAVKVMSEEGSINHHFSGIQIPKVDLDVTPDLNFLLRARTFDTNDVPWRVTQAFQRFKFRMNENGARAKVTTGIAVTMEAFFAKPDPLILDRPFLGWFTQKGLELLPMAVFWADYDSWKEPSGSLENL